MSLPFVNETFGSNSTSNSTASADQVVRENLWILLSRFGSDFFAIIYYICMDCLGIHLHALVATPAACVTTFLTTIGVLSISYNYAYLWNNDQFFRNCNISLYQGVEYMLAGLVLFATAVLNLLMFILRCVGRIIGFVKPWAPERPDNIALRAPSCSLLNVMKQSLQFGVRIIGRITGVAVVDDRNQPSPNAVHAQPAPHAYQQPAYQHGGAPLGHQQHHGAPIQQHRPEISPGVFTGAFRSLFSWSNTPPPASHAAYGASSAQLPAAGPATAASAHPPEPNRRKRIVTEDAVVKKFENADENVQKLAILFANQLKKDPYCYAEYRSLFTGNEESYQLALKIFNDEDIMSHVNEVLKRTKRPKTEGQPSQENIDCS